MEKNSAPAAILVIDDEPGMRDMLKNILPRQGYEVAVAENGEQAVENARLRDFDLAICDIMMPGMDGVATLQTLKRLRPDLEVIMATGYATVDTAISSLKSGAYDYVAKPYTLDHLFDVLKKALEHRRLKTKVDELETANRVKSEFLANMSHELRTPLNAIVGYTSLILDGVYGAIPANQNAVLGRVLANSKNLLALINNILDFSKLNAGMMPVFLEEFDAGGLVGEVVHTLQCLAAQKGLSLKADAPVPVPMRSDKTKVKQILINLTANAIKFTDKGGVTLRAAMAQDGSEAVLSVQDTGPGIAPEHRACIFEQFTQLDGSVTRRHGGTGLGLSITKKLCALLDGDITVESLPGAGATFVARLPCAMRPPEADMEAPPQDAAGDGHRKTLLCIDDDPEVLRLLRDSLSGTEYDFRGATCAEDGLAMARKLKPFVITLDILMPRRDGWSVLQEIKNDPELRAIPVFILSILENRALGFSLGVADYIVKPFDRKVLLEKLRSQERLLSLRVLVADNDPASADIFRAGLAKEGFQVDTVSTGREALARLRRAPAAAVFLDLDLPDMSGFDVVEEIEKDPGLRGQRIFLLTAKNLTDAQKARLQVGVETVIQKWATSLPEILCELKKQLTAMAAKEDSRAASLTLP